MNQQIKINRSKVTSQTRQNDELEKKLNVLSSELENTEYQKHNLKTKLNDLSKEIRQLKKEYINPNGSFDKGLPPRSVSPKVVTNFKFFKQEKKVPKLASSSAHLIGVIQKLTNRSQSGLFSPKNNET